MPTLASADIPLRTYAVPLAQDVLVFFDVLSGLDDIFQRSNGLHYFDVLGIDGLGLFEHHDSIGAVWQCAARGDLHGFTFDKGAIRTSSP